MVKFGTDLSSHNTSYQNIIKDNEFVIVKVTQGVNYTNPLSTAQSALAEKLNKKVGYYHFMEAGVDATAQAKYFLAQVGADAKKDGYLLVLDYEADGEKATGKSFTGNEPKVFMDYVYAQTGKRMVFYTMGSWAGGAGRFNWSDINSTYGLWLAAYPYGDSRAWQQAQTDWAIAQYGGYWGKNVFMHQYTSSPYDRNVLLGDWNKYANKAVKVVKPAVKTVVKPAVKTAVKKGNQMYESISDAYYKQGDLVKVKGSKTSYGNKATQNVKDAIGAVAAIGARPDKKPGYMYLVHFTNAKTGYSAYWHFNGEDLKPAK